MGIDKMPSLYYQHVTLKGQPFSYKGTGGAILLACYLLWWFIFSVFLVLQVTLCARFIPVCSLDLRYSLYAVKSLQYQANMTSLNDIRFGLTAQ